MNTKNLFFFSRFAAGGYSIGLVARSENSLQPIQKELEQQGHTGYLFLFLSNIYINILFYSLECYS